MNTPSNIVTAPLPIVETSKPEALTLSVEELFLQAGIEENVAQQAAAELVFVARRKASNVEEMLNAAGEKGFAPNTIGNRALNTAFTRPCRYEHEAVLKNVQNVVAYMQTLGLLDQQGRVASTMLQPTSVLSA